MKPADVTVKCSVRLAEPWAVRDAAVVNVTASGVVAVANVCLVAAVSAASVNGAATTPNHVCGPVLTLPLELIESV